ARDSAAQPAARAAQGRTAEAGRDDPQKDPHDDRPAFGRPRPDPRSRPAPRACVLPTLPARPPRSSPTSEGGTMSDPVRITLDDMRRCFTSAVVCDALDAAGLPHQAPRVPLVPMTVDRVLVGRCKTTLWAAMAHAENQVRGAIRGGLSATDAFARFGVL